MMGLGGRLITGSFEEERNVRKKVAGGGGGGQRREDLELGKFCEENVVVSSWSCFRFGSVQSWSCDPQVRWNLKSGLWGSDQCAWMDA